MLAADYTGVDTREKAWRAVERGELVAILMMPARFGGDERDENIVFVPEAIADRKEEIDDTVILPLIQAGRRVEYTVEPEYDGRCFVPIALNVRGHDGVDPFVFRLAIWGKGLRDRAG